MAQYFTVLE